MPFCNNSGSYYLGGLNILFPTIKIYRLNIIHIKSTSPILIIDTESGNFISSLFNCNFLNNITTCYFKKKVSNFGIYHINVCDFSTNLIQVNNIILNPSFCYYSNKKEIPLNLLNLFLCFPHNPYNFFFIKK